MKITSRSFAVFCAISLLIGSASVANSVSPGVGLLMLQQSSGGNSCSAPANGSCGGCAVSCPSSSAAQCVPGVLYSVGNPITGYRQCYHNSQCYCAPMKAGNTAKANKKKAK